MIFYFPYDEIEKDRLRIFDFIISNPVHIQRMTLRSELLKKKNLFKEYGNRYQNFDPYGLFESMRPVQSAVFLKLKEIGVIKEHPVSERYILNSNALPNELIDVIKDVNNSISKQAIQFIVDNFVGQPLLGPKGLKYASKLMEYKYDIT